MNYYIGDGDSKTLLGISNSDPYDGIEIKKKSASIMPENVWERASAKS